MAADLTRRDALKLISGAPLLPLAGLPMSLLAGCATRPSGPAVVSATFQAMPAPVTTEARAKTTVGSKLALRYSDGTAREYNLGYQPLFLTGDALPDGKGGKVLAGGYTDIKGRPVMDPSADAPAQFFSDFPDGFSLLTLPRARVPNVRGNTVFAVVQFEHTSADAKGGKMLGRLPAPVAVVTLDQDPITGALGVVKYASVDTAPAHGLWTTCGASLSPWNTHLGSEESEPDAVTIAANKQFREYSRNLYGDETAANPYHYGHVPEVTVMPDGTGRVRKHFCLGRISHELIQVMPDRRTALMGDDATNGGLFMFIADRAEDLSVGTLYVGRVAQRAGEAMDRGGSFDLNWIRLGHATSAEIEALANRLRAQDIVEVSAADPGNGAVQIPYLGKRQWVRFRPGMEKAAAFLETRRWAATVGGTLAFTKMEGVTVNARDRIAYMAMSYINRSMSDGRDGIQVDEIKAGAVYQLRLAEATRDSAGERIDSDWVPVHMETVPALVGVDLATQDPAGNTADADHIANPDNLKFSERLRTLFVAEDSDMHINNFVWAYNVDTKALARVLACPVGAESSGLQAVDDINGFSYVMSAFQHAGEWKKPLHNYVRAAVAPWLDTNYRGRKSAVVGYIHGVPARSPTIPVT